MVIKPKIRGFICTTAHPEGCAANVREQIELVQARGPVENGPKSVLVIGASGGYGLPSRIAAAFGCGAATMGVFFDRPASGNRTAQAGWYNAIAFEKAARDAGLYSRTFHGDAFSHEMKQQVVDAIRADNMPPIDLVVYSLAAPVRVHPDSGDMIRSVIKPVGSDFHGRTLNTDRGEVVDIVLEPASDEEIANTVTVMGGQDWELWMAALADAGVLADGCKTVDFTYIGSKETWPIYWEATLGKAKEDLDRAAAAMNDQYKSLNLDAHVAVMKAVVTQSSSAIPVVPLYVSILFKAMKEQGTHEGCIEQVQRLFATQLYGEGPLRLDEANRIRMDDLELSETVQDVVSATWPVVQTDTLADMADFAGYQADFLRIFGFGVDGVDYDADVEHLIDWDFG